MTILQYLLVLFASELCVCEVDRMAEVLAAREAKIAEIREEEETEFD
jgi:hypothetical protein